MPLDTSGFETEDDTSCCSGNGHGDYCQQQPIADRPLSADLVDDIGLDSSGCDGDERFPYRWSNLTEEERAWVRVLPPHTVDRRCTLCEQLLGLQTLPGCPLCGPEKVAP